MPRTKYVYSVYDLEKKTHIAFFSSLDRAHEFTLAHNLKVKKWDDSLNKIGYYYNNKHKAAILFNPTNDYKQDYYLKNYTHIFIKIPLDSNGQIQFLI